MSKYALSAGRVIVGPSGLKLAFLDRNIPGALDDAISPTEADRLAHQIVDALNAPDELEALRRIARAALAVDIGPTTKRRLDTFGELGAALVAYNGAPLGFRGPLNPDAPTYPRAPAPIADGSDSSLWRSTARR